MFGLAYLITVIAIGLLFAGALLRAWTPNMKREHYGVVHRANRR